MPEHILGYKIIPSRVGDLTLVWREDEIGPKVVKVLLPSQPMGVEYGTATRHPQRAMDDLSEQVRRYLDGQDIELPINLLDSSCCSGFQWRVLTTEKTIPRGRVCSYGQLAAMIGSPRAARAVGNALAHNPFPIIIPCHRTVRSDGQLGGFGGGLPMKRELLRLEGVEFDGRGNVQRRFFWRGSR